MLILATLRYSNQNLSSVLQGSIGQLSGNLGKQAKQSTWMDRWVTLPWPEATHRFPVRLKFYVLLFLFPR